MLNAACHQDLNSQTFVCPAEVVEVGRDQLYRVRARFADAVNDQADLAWALLSVELAGDLVAGDKVLITGESIDACYIIGVIKRVSDKHSKAEPARITSRNGAYAQANNEQGKESIQVRDKNHNLIFEYDTDQQRATISISEGDLCLNAPNGGIQLFSSEGIHCRSLGEVQLESRKEIRLKVPSASATPVSALQLSAQRASLSGQTCEIKARQADIQAEDTRFEGESVTATFARSKLVTERLETVAKRIFQRAVNIFCRVENLQQTQAGKVRTVVTEDYYLKAEHTDIHADKDIKINGDRIYLG